MCVLDRLVPNYAQWERMAPLIIGRPDQKGSTDRDNRMFFECALWIVHTGSPWHDLPEALGEWDSVFQGADIRRAQNHVTRTEQEHRSSRRACG